MVTTDMISRDVVLRGIDTFRRCYFEEEQKHGVPTVILNTANTTLSMVESFVNKTPLVNTIVCPPVNIGDKAYFIINKQLYEAEVCFLNHCQYRGHTSTEIRGEVSPFHTVSAEWSDWNKTVFKTKEEAERVLYPCEHCISGTYRSCEGCSQNKKEDKS